MRLLPFGCLFLIASCLGPLQVVDPSASEPDSERKPLSELSKRLHDPDATVRQDAVRALGDTGPENEAVVPALIEALRDPDGNVRGEAASALGKLGLRAKAAVPALSEALDGFDSAVEVEAAMALWKIDRQTKVAVPILCEALKEKETREKAAWYLSEIGPEAKPAVPLLTELLTDRSDHLRIHAAAALWSIDRQPQTVLPVAVDVLHRAAASEDPFSLLSLLSAIGVLGAMGPEAKEAVPELVALIEDERQGFFPKGFYRDVVLEALAAIGPEAKAAVPAVTKLLKAKEGFTRVLAAYALWRIDRQTQVALAVFLKELANRKEELVPIMAARALSDMGPEAKPAVPALLELLKSRDANVRLEAVKTLGAVGPEAAAAVPALREARKDRKASVQQEAGEALKKIDPQGMDRVEGR
jgi:HEAT repeat protein